MGWEHVVVFLFGTAIAPGSPTRLCPDGTLAMESGPEGVMYDTEQEAVCLSKMPFLNAARAEAKKRKPGVSGNCRAMPSLHMHGERMEARKTPSYIPQA